MTPYPYSVSLNENVGEIFRSRSGVGNVWKEGDGYGGTRIKTEVKRLARSF